MDFYLFIVPYAFCLLVFLIISLVMLEFKYWLDGETKLSSIDRKIILWFKTAICSVRNRFQKGWQRLFGLIPFAVRNDFSLGKKEIGKWVLKNRFVIFGTYYLEILLISIFIINTVLPVGVLFLPVVILLFVITHSSMDRIVLYFAGDSLFKVCPSCGFGNHLITDECDYCSFNGSDSLKELILCDVPQSLQNEMSEYKKRCYRKPSKAILRGMKLEKDEVVLIFARVTIIIRNQIRVVVDGSGCPCCLNRVALTNRKIYFISEGHGGWRAIDSYPYGNITQYMMGARKNPDRLGILDDINTLTILTSNDNEYFIKGFNPGMLFKTIIKCIKKRGCDSHQHETSEEDDRYKLHLVNMLK